MYSWLSRIILFIAATLLLILGSFALIIPWFDSLQIAFIVLLIGNPWTIFFIGIGLFVIGSLVLSNLVEHSKRYYQITSLKDFPITIDKAIFQRYLSTYWKKTFPQQKIIHKIDLQEDKLLIIAELPYIPTQARDSLIEKIHGELGDILSRIVGYTGTFALSISFQKENKKLS